MRNESEIIAQAWQLHQQGDARRAEQLCLELLHAHPANYAALHLRGLIALGRGEDECGIELIGRSLQIAPNQPAAHSNIGNALLERKQPSQALQRFERALSLKPDYLVAWYNRGNALLQLGRFADAVASYDRALQLKADYAGRCGIGARRCSR